MIPVVNQASCADVVPSQPRSSDEWQRQNRDLFSQIACARRFGWNPSNANKLGSNAEIRSTVRSGSRRQVSRPRLAAFAFIAMSALRRRQGMVSWIPPKLMRTGI